TAIVEWQPEGTAPRELPTLTLSPDRLGATAALRLKQSGTLRLITYTEQNGKSLRYETSVPVQVKPDEPPRFERRAGAGVGAARRGGGLPSEFAATDDIAVGSAVLEYATGPPDSPPVAVPVPLTGSGTAKAEGRLDFDLIGKGRAGDTVRFRLRVADTRRLDEGDLKPQEAVYPETGWLAVRIDPAAAPLEQQGIAGPRHAGRAAPRAALAQGR